MQPETFDPIETSHALESTGFTREQAETIVHALRRLKEADLATKADLDTQTDLLRGEMERRDTALRGEMERRDAALRGEMDQLRVELRAEMSQLRGELLGEMERRDAALRSEMNQLRVELRSEMAALKDDLTVRVGGMLGATVAILVALDRFLA